MMSQRKWLVRGVALMSGGLLVLGGWLAMRSAPAASEQPQVAGKRELEAIALSRPGPGDPRPRAVVDDREHNFGVMDLGHVGTHRFVIRNEGDAPLVLHKGPTTCRCTLSNLADDTIPPGGTGEVELSWEPRVGGTKVRQSATILTNDPENEEIKFVITGDVLAFVTATPAALLFPDVQPGRSATRRAVVYSQAWDHFEIAGIDSNGPALSWDVAPASSELLEKIGAKSGYLVEVTLQAGLPAGEFSGRLTVRVAFPRHSEAGEVPPLQLNVAGKVLGSVAIYHPRIRQGRLDLGGWSSGSTFTETIPVYFRGEHAGASIAQLRAEPEFVSLREVKHDRLSDRVAVHTLELKVSGAVRPGEYVGEIVIVSDHPTNPEVRMPLHFVVTTSDPIRAASATAAGGMGGSPALAGMPWSNGRQAAHATNRAAETAGRSSGATSIRSKNTEQP